MLKLLDILLKDKISAEEKKKRLHEEFHIPMSQNIESEVGVMCNLSDGIEQRGIEIGEKRGEKRGRTQGEINLIKNLMESMEVNMEQAMELLKISPKKQKNHIKLLNSNIMS